VGVFFSGRHLSGKVIKPAVRAPIEDSMPYRRWARGRVFRGLAVALLLPAVVLVGATVPADASAAPDAVDLGSAGAASVLGGATVTSTGKTVLSADLDTYPGTAATGLRQARRH
jgi:hypothetical protein